MSEELSWRLSGHRAAFFFILYSAQQARMPLEKWESLKSVSKPVQLPPQCITSFHVAALFANLNKSPSILKNAYTCISPAYKTMSDCFNVRLTAFWIILAVSGLFSQKMNSELTSSLALRDRKKHRIDKATRRKSHALRAWQELPLPLFPLLPLRPISFHTFHIFISHTIACTFISPRSIWLGWVKIVGM